MMYESPIDMIYRDIQCNIQEQIEGAAISAVQSCGINVKKEELIKALNYDRQQYEKGYADAKAEQQWIPCKERLPSEEERKEWIDKNLGGIGYLYPCLVTRYSRLNPDRTINNPYVAKHYYDGDDFVNNGEEVCTEYIIAWMPLPAPYREDET